MRSLTYGDLDDRYAARLEDGGDATDHAVEIGHVGEHVVPVHDVGGAAAGHQLCRQLGAEELAHGGDPAFLAGHPRDIGGGFDAEHRDTLVMVVLQEIAVVAGDLDREAVGSQFLEVDQAPDDPFRVLHDRVREGREIGVLTEEHFRRYRLGDLDEGARGTEDEVQRKGGFRLTQLLGGQQRVGEGCAA